MRRPSRVLIVGAGSGGPGSITLDGLDALRSADLVVYDRLIHQDLLRHARPGAELVYAGKAPGRHAMSQEEINRLLLEGALRGLRVVRLKGGDPLFFGRGEEECVYLLRRGVPCKVIPGVPSPFAAAARFLIPLAGRGFSSSVGFTTGVLQGGRLLGRERIARMLEALDTVVFLMATRLYPTIVEETLRVRGPREGVAIVEDLGGSERLTLGAASSPEILGARPEPPAIIIVGGAARWAIQARERSGYSS